MEHHVDRVLIDRRTIARRVEQMAHQIAIDLRLDSGDNQPQLTLLAVLTGSLIFLSDLMRHLPLMMRLRLITVSSYPGKATATQGPRLEGSLPDDLAGQHVLVVDDILDSGRTIEVVRQQLLQRHPASVRVAALLRKQRADVPQIDADYVGFEIPDEFVVGYGLDYDGYYRNLPDLVTLKPEVIA